MPQRLRGSLKGRESESALGKIAANQFGKGVDGLIFVRAFRTNEDGVPGIDT